MYWYQIYPEHKLTVGGYAEDITIKDMKELALEIWADPLYDKTYLGIIDYSRARMDISPAGIHEIADYFISQNDTLIGKAALIVTTPMETAINWIFAKQMKAKNRIGVFSTWDAAVDFLNISIPPSVIPLHFRKK